MISSLASFLPADPSPEEPPLPADALVFLNLMLRQGILGRQFSTAGGLPEALGRFLFDSRLLRRISARDPSGALTGESVARALTAWSRRQDYPDAHLGLSRQLPALVALFLNAEAS
jgi:hypothetical protein